MYSYMRSRAWTFTTNNYTDEQCWNLVNLSCRYLVFSFEVAPTTGTPHIQGYVYFHDAKTESYMIKHVGCTWTKPSKGSPQQNFDYCSKTGDYFEFGKMPEQGKAQWQKIKDVMKDPKSNPHLFQQYQKTYKQIKKLDKKEHERKLYLIKESDKYTFAKDYETVTFDSTLETYEDEQLIIMPSYSSVTPVMDWIHGYPTKIKRGYEVVTVDPQAIAITYSNPKEYNYVFNLLGDHFDKVL